MTAKGFPFRYKIDLESPSGYQAISHTKGSPSNLKEERKYVSGHFVISSIKKQRNIT